MRELWYLHNEGCSGRKHSTSILQEIEKASKYFSSFVLSPEVEILSPKEPTAQRALPHFSLQPAARAMRGTFTTSASFLLTANPKINAQGRSWIAAPWADTASKASELSACLCYPAPPPAHASLQTRWIGVSSMQLQRGEGYRQRWRDPACSSTVWGVNRLGPLMNANKCCSLLNVTDRCRCNCI